MIGSVVFKLAGSFDDSESACSVDIGCCSVCGDPINCVSFMVSEIRVS